MHLSVECWMFPFSVSQQNILCVCLISFLIKKWQNQLFEYFETRIVYIHELCYVSSGAYRLRTNNCLTSSQRCDECLVNRSAIM